MSWSCLPWVGELVVLSSLSIAWKHTHMDFFICSLEQMIHRACQEPKMQPPHPPPMKVALHTDCVTLRLCSLILCLSPSPQSCPFLWIFPTSLTVTLSRLDQDREEVLSLLKHCLCFLSPFAEQKIQVSIQT